MNGEIFPIYKHWLFMSLWNTVKCNLCSLTQWLIYIIIIVLVIQEFIWSSCCHSHSAVDVGAVECCVEISHSFDIQIVTVHFVSPPPPPAKELISQLSQWLRDSNFLCFVNTNMKSKWVIKCLPSYFSKKWVIGVRNWIASQHKKLISFERKQKDWMNLYIGR